MDCCYIDKHENSRNERTFANVSSPEMFDSDAENTDTNIETIAQDVLPEVANSPEKPSQAELVARSDHNLLARINKLLSGVPPPPKHTICRSDCSEFLLRIYENRHLFWTSPFSEKKSQQNTNHKSSEGQNDNRDSFYERTRNTSRNLSNAFDACDSEHQNTLSNNVTTVNVQKDVSGNNSNVELSNYNVTESVPDTSENVMLPSSSNEMPLEDENNAKKLPSNCLNQESLFYHTVNEKEAIALTWPEVYQHKFHGIHYNRNKAIEEFENLSIKLCERYIGAETQSTCNVWFSKQGPGSARKRSLLAKRDNGQSPGKRLNYLTRRRRTFSSANLQGLGLNDKKQLVLNVKKSYGRKGKSPRGKSPRGKSPRGKSPRSSTKKKVARRLVLDGPSPLKSKLETSKRALFQSPNSDRAGPSKLFTSGPTPQNIKRALFPTLLKCDDDGETFKKTVVEESRKRKNEDELEGPKFKWPKSLSFDCPHELHDNSIVPWDNERHSSSNIVEKNKASFAQGKSELSDTHRKKLLWAVAEALRSKGIGMNHPQFKQYASSLARTIKKFMPDLENRNIPRKPGSTTDRMLKLAKHHVLFIIDARPAD